MSNKEWTEGGIFTCKFCGWKIRLPSHMTKATVKVPSDPSPLKEIKIWKKHTRKISI